MKTKFSITKKREVKISEMKKKTDLKYQILLTKKKQKIEQGWEHEIEKMEKKKNSEIKKKEERFIRKMNNEIREFEGKPKRKYKQDAPKLNPIQFAMDLAQENAKLRDTDENGNGCCISCNKGCSWGELAGGHRYSRRMKTVCLEVENVNAQCHTCNWTTGPRGDAVAKERVNNQYDINLDKKYGKGTAKVLAKKVRDYIQGKGKKYDLDYEIPRLIDENEKLWKTKNFYAPKKRWRPIWIKWKNRN